MRHICKFFMKRFLLAFVPIIAFVISAGAFARAAWLRAPAPEANAVAFEIAARESSKVVTKRLEEAGLTDHPFWLRVYLKRSGADRRLQTGSFSLKPGMSFAALASALSRAESHEVQITIPEGYTVAQIGQVVRAALPTIDEASWQAAGGASSPLKAKENMLAHLPEGQGLEGYLFPDTYRFREDMGAEAVAGVMVTTLERRLAEAGVSFQNLHESLTLASIIEREVQTPEDMRLVADLFGKRLASGMALQADSTVNYVTGGKSPSVSAADLEINSRSEERRVGKECRSRWSP